MENKIIVVTLEVEVPGNATDKDIQDFVDVEFAQCNGRKVDNPCIDNFEILDHLWKEV